ncbi:MAG: FAD-binding oxidoreductase, partial [candidate division Zixibacteria bacterium]|nr:FAD-binding oxidoreductase [candidate division Zixibacteria bacterium]
GGGIIGLSVAFYLARAKYGQIVVLEKERFLGSGSTAKAAGGIRAQFANRVNIELSMLSEKLFRQFKEDTGWDAVFDQVGYLFLLSDDSDIAQFKRNFALQRSLGLNVEMMQPSDIPRVAPHVRLDDIRCATFCPDDGLGDPYQFLSGYEHAARTNGAEIEPDTAVTGFTMAGDVITHVNTSRGTIASPLVINCAGAFAGEIGKMAGSDIQVLPYRRQCVTTGELDFIEPYFPMVVDVKSGLYCHKESRGLLLGWADKATKPSYDISIDPDYTDAIVEKALDRIPGLETAEVANVWAGLYETTPDHQAIFGWDSGVQGLFHVAGFSGHGFMQAPAAGLITLQILTDKKPSVDISELRPDRFVAGSVIAETNVI